MVKFIEILEYIRVIKDKEIFSDIEGSLLSSKQEAWKKPGVILTAIGKSLTHIFIASQAEICAYHFTKDELESTEILNSIEEYQNEGYLFSCYNVEFKRVFPLLEPTPDRLMEGKKNIHIKEALLWADQALKDQRADEALIFWDAGALIVYKGRENFIFSESGKVYGGQDALRVIQSRWLNLPCCVQVKYKLEEETQVKNIDDDAITLLSEEGRGDEEEVILEGAGSTSKRKVIDTEEEPSTDEKNSVYEKELPLVGPQDMDFLKKYGIDDIKPREKKEEKQDKKVSSSEESSESDEAEKEASFEESVAFYEKELPPIGPEDLDILQKYGIDEEKKNDDGSEPQEESSESDEAEKEASFEESVAFYEKELPPIGPEDLDILQKYGIDEGEGQQVKSLKQEGSKPDKSSSEIPVAPSLPPPPSFLFKKKKVEEPVAQFEEEQEEPVAQFEEEQEEPVAQFEEEQEEPVAQFEEEQEEPVAQFEEEQEEPAPQFEEEQEEPAPQFEEEQEEPAPQFEEESGFDEEQGESREGEEFSSQIESGEEESVHFETFEEEADLSVPPAPPLPPLPSFLKKHEEPSTPLKEKSGVIFEFQDAFVPEEPPTPLKEEEISSDEQMPEDTESASWEEMETPLIVPEPSEESGEVAGDEQAVEPPVQAAEKEPIIIAESISPALPSPEERIVIAENAGIQTPFPVGNFVKKPTFVSLSRGASTPDREIEVVSPFKDQIKKPIFEKAATIRIHQMGGKKRRSLKRSLTFFLGIPMCLIILAFVGLYGYKWVKKSMQESEIEKKYIVPVVKGLYKPLDEGLKTLDRNLQTLKNDFPEIKNPEAWELLDDGNKEREKLEVAINSAVDALKAGRYKEVEITMSPYLQPLPGFEDLLKSVDTEIQKSRESLNVARKREESDQNAKESRKLLKIVKQHLTQLEGEMQPLRDKIAIFEREFPPAPPRAKGALEDAEKEALRLSKSLAEAEVALQSGQYGKAYENLNKVNSTYNPESYVFTIRTFTETLDRELKASLKRQTQEDIEEKELLKLLKDNTEELKKLMAEVENRTSYLKKEFSVDDQEANALIEEGRKSRFEWEQKIETATQLRSEKGVGEGLSILRPYKKPAPELVSKFSDCLKRVTKSIEDARRASYKYKQNTQLAQELIQKVKDYISDAQSTQNNLTYWVSEFKRNQDELNRTIQRAKSIGIPWSRSINSMPFGVENQIEAAKKATREWGIAATDAEEKLKSDKPEQSLAILNPFSGGEPRTLSQLKYTRDEVKRAYEYNSKILKEISDKVVQAEKNILEQRKKSPGPWYDELDKRVEVLKNLDVARGIKDTKGHMQYVKLINALRLEDGYPNKMADFELLLEKITSRGVKINNLIEVEIKKAMSSRSKRQLEELKRYLDTKTISIPLTSELSKLDQYTSNLKTEIAQGNVNIETLKAINQTFFFINRSFEESVHAIEGKLIHIEMETR